MRVYARPQAFMFSTSPTQREKWPFSMQNKEIDEKKRAELKKLESEAMKPFDREEDKLRDWQGNLHFSTQKAQVTSEDSPKQGLADEKQN